MTSAARRRPRGIDVAPAAAIGTDYDELWDRARGDYEMAVRRDAAYVTWKYRDASHKNYRIVEARRGSTLTGFAVSRTENYRGIVLGWIVDVFTPGEERDSRDALLADVLDGFRAAGVARAQAFSCDERLAEGLQRHGFFSRSSRSHLCARPNGATDSPLASTKRWHVVFGDGDSDR